MNIDLIFFSIFSRKKFWIKGPKKNWVRKNCSKKFTSEQNFGSKIHVGPKKFESKKILSLTKFGFIEVWSKKILVSKNSSLQKLGKKRFGQNRVSNSRNIAYMDKCCQSLWCSDNVTVTVGIFSRCSRNYF